MKSFFSRLGLWWKSRRKRVKAAIIAVLAIILIVILTGGSGDGSVTIEEVKRENLTKTVLASGSVVSSTDLALSFEASKIIDTVKVKVGDVVKTGDILASQKNASERASYNAARGALLAAEARYTRVLDGSSNEEIALAQTALSNAKKDLELAKKVQEGTVENARRRLNSEGIEAKPRNSSTSTAPTITGTYTGQEGEYRIEPTFEVGVRLKVTGLENTTAAVSDLSPQPLGTKGLNILFPNKNALSGSDQWIISIPNTSSSSYIANLNAYNSAKDSSDAAIASAEAIVAQREAELNLKRATARQSEVDAALADIVSARAQVDQAYAVLEKTILRAPADGTITKVNVKIGEVPDALIEAIVLQDVSNLYLEANINESQIRDVAVGQDASVTFDALDGDRFNATVSSVDLAATITDSIVNYEMKALLTNTENVRPGMTADISVITDEVPDTLVVPSRALTYKDGKYYADRIIDIRKNKTETVEVQIGIRGDGDMVEIRSGLNEGDKLLWKTV